MSNTVEVQEDAGNCNVGDGRALSSRDFAQDLDDFRQNVASINNCHYLARCRGCNIYCNPFAELKGKIVTTCFIIRDVKGCKIPSYSAGNVYNVKYSDILRYLVLAISFTKKE